MKMLFICDWEFTYVWEKVAARLLNLDVASDCVALVVGRLYKNELDRREQKVFSKTYLLQDAVEHVTRGSVDWERLREFENKYAYPTLWRYVWADRSWVHSEYEEICKRLITTFDFYESLYATHEPHIIVTTGYGSMPHLIGHVVARRKGIPMFHTMHCRIEDRYVPGYSALEELEWIDDYLTGKVEPLLETKKAVSDYLARFREKPEKPDYEDYEVIDYRFDMAGVYRLFRYAYRYWISRSYANDHTKKNPLAKIKRELELRICRRLRVRSQIWDPLPDDAEYIYFPLHLQPEQSTLTFAPYYLDQISIVSNLAKSVPVTTRIVVKEHPFMVGRREIAYYKEMKRLPNVILVNPFMDTFQLIRNAQMVFTITGTAALEAAILGKPAVSLGDTVYKKCPAIKYAGDIAPTQWAALIKKVIADYKTDDEGLRRFLGGIFDHSFSCALNEPLTQGEKVFAEDNIDKIANVLRAEMEKIKTDPSYGRLPL